MITTSDRRFAVAPVILVELLVPNNPPTGVAAISPSCPRERPYAPPAKLTGLSRGPALVCGRRGFGLLRLYDDDATALLMLLSPGDGGITSSRSRSGRDRRGDFDLDLELPSLTKES